MARTPSTMLALGSKLPTFELSNGVDPQSFHSGALVGKNGLLVMFICNHCPFVIHVKEELIRLADWAAKMGIGVVAINSNDVANYPADSPEKMIEEGYAFPYLYDESQQVAKAFQAACTPDFYLFDQHQTLVYRGQLDGSRPGNEVPVTGSDLRSAMQFLVEKGHVPSEHQTPSLGCNIKWKSGSAPAYFG